MSQFKILFFVGLISIKLFAQNKEFQLDYQTELPFQTVVDSDYYHLESAMLLRNITNDIFEIIKREKNSSNALQFKLLFKSHTGAQLPVDYAQNPIALKGYFASKESQLSLKKATYEWLNRSFRSNIPYKE